MKMKSARQKLLGPHTRAVCILSSRGRSAGAAAFIDLNAEALLLRVRVDVHLELPGRSIVPCVTVLAADYSISCKTDRPKFAAYAGIMCSVPAAAAPARALAVPGEAHRAEPPSRAGAGRCPRPSGRRCPPPRRGPRRPCGRASRRDRHALEGLAEGPGLPRDSCATWLRSPPRVATTWATMSSGTPFSGP